MLGTVDNWLPVGDIRATSDGGLEAVVLLEPSSEWFSGHFDECAVVPGVALLALVAEVALRQTREQGHPFEVCGFSRVRFRRFAFPDEEIRISVASVPYGVEAEIDFNVTCKGEVVTRGIMKVRERRKR